MMRAGLAIGLATGLVMLALVQPAQAREAAFVDPGQAGTKNDQPATIYTTPSHSDVGETIIGVTKRITVFFNNGSGRKVKISDLTVTSDSNVTAKIVSDDCAQLAEIPPGERCAVGVEITPTSPGPWNAEMLMVHDAPGRVAQAMMMGISAGEVGNSGQQPGLSLIGSGKDQEVDFGDVEVGLGKAVRTVLLVNDSANPLTILGIDLVAPDKGLSLVEKGSCLKDMVIPAAASCPVTVMWQPLGRGNVSTDLIINHTGPVGYAVIPVRGTASGDARAGGGRGVSASGEDDDGEATKAAGKLPVSSGVPGISAASLFAQAAGSGAAESKLVLRGTVGSRAILSDLSGNISVAAVGDTLVVEGIAHKVIGVNGSHATIDVEGTVVDLSMGNGVSSGGDSKSSGGSTGSGRPTSAGAGTPSDPSRPKSKFGAPSLPSVSSQGIPTLPASILPSSAIAAPPGTPSPPVNP